MHNMNGKQQVLSDADLALVWRIQTIKASVIFSLFSCSYAESMSTLHPSTRVLWLFTVQGRSDFIHICSISAGTMKENSLYHPNVLCCPSLPWTQSQEEPSQSCLVHSTSAQAMKKHIWRAQHMACSEILLAGCFYYYPCCQPVPSPGWLSSPTIIPPVPAPKLGKPAMSWRETSTHAVPPEWKSFLPVYPLKSALPGSPARHQCQ